MTTPSGLVQHQVASALKEALREHCGSGDANQETAAMRGVIDFLKNYMKKDGKTTSAAKRGGDKMKGEAARLALTAMNFANKCGGLDIKFHSENEDVNEDGEEESQDEQQNVSVSQYTSSELRKHDKTVREELVKGKRLYGKTKYLQEYKLGIYYKEQHNLLATQATEAEGNPMKDLILSAIETKTQDLGKEKLKCEKLLSRWNKEIEKAEQCLIADEHGNIMLQPEGSTVLLPLPNDIVMIDENGEEYYDARIEPGSTNDNDVDDNGVDKVPNPATPIADGSIDDDENDDYVEPPLTETRDKKRKASFVDISARNKKKK